MSQPPPLPKRRGNKLLLWLVLSGGLLLVLSFVAWRISISWQVRSKLAALRQAGYPTTPQELEQKYYAPVDPASNAAPFFNAAFAWLTISNSVSQKALEKFVGTTTNLAASFSATEATIMTSLLANNRRALELLHQMPTATTCRYPLDFSMGPAMLLPHLSKIQNTIWLLSLEAVWDSSNGRATEAVDDLDAAFRVADSLKEEPVLISQLVRIRDGYTISFGLQRILTRQALTDSQLAHLAEEFQKEENSVAMEHALAGELCTGILVFQMPLGQLASLGGNSDSGDDNSTSGQAGSKFGFALLKLSGFTARDFNFYLKTMSQYLAADRLPFPQKLDAAKRAENAFLTNCAGHFYIFSGLLIPSLAKSASKDAAALANLHDVQTALAIERFRLANQDRLPDKLSDLVPAFLPAVPADPFNGEPLHYKKLSTGYEVYSVGPNRQDDGGVKSTKLNGPDDITFTVER